MRPFGTDEGQRSEDKESCGPFLVGQQSFLPTCAACDPAITIHVPVRLVPAPTIIFSKDGKLIPNLSASDFRVFDNDRLQKASLDSSIAPISLAFAVAATQDVRAYLPFVAKSGALVETLLVGETGESAVIVYGDELSVIKPFESGDLQSTLRKVSIFAVALPEFGRAFVSDTFSLEGLTRERGGFKAGADLGKLISVLNRNSKIESATDPFSLLTSATGGTQLRARNQKEFEKAIDSVGVQLRSLYLLSYSPSSSEIGYHTIKVEVDVPGATVHTRRGYSLSAN